MAKRDLRKQAVLLRKNGCSYSEIKSRLGIAKSTLSDWVKDIPKPKFSKLQKMTREQKRVERYITTMEQKRKNRDEIEFCFETKLIGSLSRREMMIGGLFLYWGEGGKTSVNQFTISNSDPDILLFVLRWIQGVYKIQLPKIRIRLTIYDTMNKQEEVEFWSKYLSIPNEQFRKVHIKNGKGIGNKGFRHGTCEIVISDAILKRRVLAGIKALKKVPNET